MRYLAPCLVAMSLASSLAADDSRLTATLKSARSVDVYAGVALRVRSVRVIEGDHVATGDTLALLNDVELRLAEIAANLDCRRADDRLGRAHRLQARGLISAQQLEGLQYDARAARVRLDLVRLNVAKACVRTPITGLVAHCAARPGDLTSPREPLFQVIDPTDLIADLYIPVDAIDTVSPGVQVVAVSELAPESPLEGHILRVSPVIDPASGTCRALASFPDAGRLLRPGTLVTIRLADPAGSTSHNAN